MASSVQAYQVTLTNGNTNSSPSDGFVDNKKVENYGVNLATTPVGWSLTTSKAKRRGNLRYIEIINQLSMVANCYVDPNSFDSDATAIAEATSFAFQIYAEHGDASLVTEDELNPGEFLNGTDCITRCIARALNADLFKEIDVFDPSSADSIGTLGATTSVPRFGSHIYAASAFEVGAYEADLATAEGFVAVAAI